jgi:hypothetical protein
MMPGRLVAAAAALTVAGCGGTPQQHPPTGALAAAADQRAARAADASETGMTCAARTFGLAPPGAKDITQVTTVYAWVFCRAPDSDTAEFVPAVVTLSGRPSIRIPSDDDYSGEIKRLFPPDVREAVYEPPKDATELTGG